MEHQNIIKKSSRFIEFESIYWYEKHTKMS